VLPMLRDHSRAAGLIGLLLALTVGLACTSTPSTGDGGGGGNGGMDGGNGDGGDGDGGNDGGSAGAGLPDLTLSGIRVHVQARIEVGDDVVLFTSAEADGTPGPAQYVIPSQGDTTAREISTPDLFDNNSFKVAGKKLILFDDAAATDRDFGVTVYDTQTQSLSPIPLADIRVASIPVSNFGPGFIDVDGGLIATINDTGSLGADGDELIRVIDVGSAEPQVIKFSVNPENDNLATPDQVCVSAESRLVVAARFVTRTFYVYDIDDPTAAPTEIEVDDMRAFDTQFDLTGNTLLFTAREGNEVFAYLLDVLDPAADPVKLETPRGGADRVRFLANLYAFQTNGGAAIGTLSDTTPATPPAGSNTGTGGTIAIGYLDNNTGVDNDTPIWFTGIQDNIPSNDPIEYSLGDGNWNELEDDDTPGDVLTAGDVHTDLAGKYLAFKYEVDDDQYLGYAILNDD
jgi:hypothetical protein